MVDALAWAVGLSQVRAVRSGASWVEATVWGGEQEKGGRRCDVKVIKSRTAIHQSILHDFDSIDSTRKSL